jgi:hypothetical protein
MADSPSLHVLVLDKKSGVIGRGLNFMHPAAPIRKRFSSRGHHHSAPVYTDVRKL